MMSGFAFCTEREALNKTSDLFDGIRKRFQENCRIRMQATIHNACIRFSCEAINFNNATTNVCAIVRIPKAFEGEKLSNTFCERSVTHKTSSGLGLGIKINLYILFIVNK